MSNTPFTVEQLPANSLLVDRRVQRDNLNLTKVETISRDFNEDALGVVTVSRRKNDGDYIIDGWHRTQAAKEKDPTFLLTCRVFEGLSVIEEAEMFLALNTTSTPSLLEKFKVRLTAEDPDSMEIDRITRDRGWLVDPIPAPGHIQAIGALYRIHELSKKVEAEPHLLDAALLVVTRAWGNDRDGGQAVILEGLARLMAKHGERIDYQRLWTVLRDRSGGVSALHSEASQMAKMERSSVRDMVSHLVTVTYNKHARSKAIPAWGSRRS